MSAAVKLVLVDLDNVWDQARALPEPATSPDEDGNWLESSGAPAAVDTGVPCVVVFAMNLETGNHSRLSYDGLRTMGERLSWLVARAPLRGVEIALTLPIKQSADKALERLLGEAPLPEHAGELAEVHLLSVDGGLRTSLEGALNPKKYGRMQRVGAFVTTWVVRGKAKRRRPPKPSVVPSDPASMPTPGVAAAIDTAALVAWAHERPVDVPAAVALHELVDLLWRRPGLLTQVGLTTTSVRGIGRMHELARGGRPVLGPCSPMDGVELCSTDVEEGLYTGAFESTLGPGAIRFAEPTATVLTWLPPNVVGCIENPLEVDEDGRVVTNGALEHVAPARLAASKRFAVSFHPNKRGLLVKVTSSFGKSIPAWWLECRSDKDKTWSDYCIEKLRVPFAAPLTNISAVSCLMVGDRRGLAVRAPHTGPIELDLRESLVGGQLGIATRGNERSAVLGRRGADHPCGALRCRAIQEVPDADLRAAYPDLGEHFAQLRRLPIMVPV